MQVSKATSSKRRLSASLNLHDKVLITNSQSTECGQRQVLYQMQQQMYIRHLLAITAGDLVKQIWSSRTTHKTYFIISCG